MVPQVSQEQCGDPLTNCQRPVTLIPPWAGVPRPFGANAPPETVRGANASRATSSLTEPEMMLGNSVLHIRDPRYGWLHYVLSRKSARKLAGLLAAQADAPPVSPPGKAN